MTTQYKEVSLEQALFLYDNGLRDFKEMYQGQTGFNATCWLNHDFVHNRTEEFWGRFRLFVPVE